MNHSLPCALLFNFYISNCTKNQQTSEPGKLNICKVLENQLTRCYGGHRLILEDYF